jgi:hypothetical protein
VIKIKKIFKTIFIFAVIIICLGITFGIIDYNRVLNDKYPLFCVKTHDEKYFNETCLGLGYKMHRKISVSPTQPLSQSDLLEFGFWIYVWKIN